MGNFFTSRPSIADENGSSGHAKKDSVHVLKEINHNYHHNYNSSPFYFLVMKALNLVGIAF